MLRIADARGREGGHQLSLHHTRKSVGWVRAPIWLLGKAELKGLSLLGELQISSSFSAHSVQLGAET